MKPIRAWAVVANGKILSVNQDYGLKIYRRRADAQQAIFYIKRDCIEKYDLAIVRVKIEAG